MPTAKRVLRAIDRAEFPPPGGTFVDRINRAEKRGHIASAYEWKEIREIRNQIVHEYVMAHPDPFVPGHATAHSRVAGDRGAAECI